MKRSKIVIAAGLVGALVITFGILALVNNNEQSAKQPVGTTLGLSNEQSIKDTEKQQEELVMQPDINNEEFVITASNVNCSSSEINGQVSKSCSGNIRVLPKENKGLNPGLYKINEETKLLHNGVEEDLTNLQQLAQNNATVKLTLATDSQEMLAKITY